MTSQSMEVKCKNKCKKCNDTGWILTPKGTYERCGCYEKERITRLWKNFGIDPCDAKKINEYEAYDEATKYAKDKAINYIKNFQMIKSSRENSLGMFGQPGSGKSHLVIATGAALLRENVNVIYMPYLEVIRELKANVNDDEYYLKISDRYKKSEVLIIDDLFKDKVRNKQLIKGACITEADMKHIYPILNFRYLNKLPTLISTECTPKILVELDEALAGRIIETCEPYMAILNGVEHNYRMRKFIR